MTGVDPSVLPLRSLTLPKSTAALTSAINVLEANGINTVAQLQSYDTKGLRSIKNGSRGIARRGIVALQERLVSFGLEPLATPARAARANVAQYKEALASIVGAADATAQVAAIEAAKALLQ